jgi:hypothetical protein
MVVEGGARRRVTSMGGSGRLVEMGYGGVGIRAGYVRGRWALLGLGGVFFLSCFGPLVGGSRITILESLLRGVRE